MPILESDWKKFKELRKIALDRFCLGVLADAETIAQHSALSPHARYRMLYRLTRDRDKDIVHTFDLYSRSSALMALRMMVMHDLLTDAELSVLSEAAREEIADVVRQPYELEWIEESEQAARIQTFPDNYFFQGSRTDQFHQVGNAVPPLLASKISKVVFGILFDKVRDYDKRLAEETKGEEAYA